MIDKTPGGPSADPDLIEQDDLPFSDDDVQVNFVDDEDDPAPVAARRGQNEDPDFFEGETDGDDEFAGVSESVRNRIMRERRLRLESERTHAQELERAENALLQAALEKAAAQRDSIAVGLDGLDVRLTTLREGLKQARADGDSSAEIDIEASIRNIETLRQQLEGQKARIPSDQVIQGEFNNWRSQERVKRQARTGGTDDARPVNRLAEQWRDRNSWMDDPARSEERKELVKVSEQLAIEGYAADTPQHFVELTKRMAKYYPNLGVRDISGRQMGPSQGQPQQSRRASSPPPVGGNRGVVPMSGVRKGKDGKPVVDLERSDAKMMRMLGLDPGNKKQAAYFAKEKLQRVTREARNGR